MKDKLTIIFFSGTYDKALAMLILATTAAAMNIDVRIFCTFWGLSFLKKGKRYRKKGLLQRMMEFMFPKSRNDLPLTNLNFLGAGQKMMKRLMKKQNMASLEELFVTAKQLGVKLYACSTSNSIMGVTKEDLIDEVDDIVGAAYFLKETTEAQHSYFI